MQAMTPNHSKWEEFIAELEGPNGCNFKMPDPGDIKSFTWKCDNTINRPLATAILEKIGGIDIPASMKFFELHGGFCDCEIVFNVPDVLAAHPNRRTAKLKIKKGECPF